MQMTGEQRIGALRQRVWEALNDPAVLRACIPGCQSLEKEGEDRFLATAEIKIGPIGARFKGAVRLGELDPPSGYRITGEGSAGIVGGASGGATVRLHDDDGGTLLVYTVDAQVSGRLAQLGGPIIDATAKQLAGRFFAKFGEVVGGAPSGSASAVDAAPASAPTGQTAPAPSAISSVPAAGPTTRRVPIAWLLAIMVAVLAGVLIGGGRGSSDAAWEGVAIGLLTIVAAAAGFDHGRRSHMTTLVLDEAMLRRLLTRDGR